MKLTDKGGSDWEQAPTGAQIGRCVRIIDIGTQTSEYQGKITHRRQGIFTFELPNALMTEGDHAGKPFLVSKFYTLSLSEKATLRKDLAAWRGRDFTPEELGGFDPRKVLGHACMLGLVENAKGKTVIGTVMQLPKGLPVPEQVNPNVFFSLEEFDQNVFDSLSKGIQELIMKSPEYEAIKDGPAPQTGGHFDDLEDSIPF